MRLHTWRGPDLCLGLGLPWGPGSPPRNTRAHATSHCEAQAGGGARTERRRSAWWTRPVAGPSGRRSGRWPDPVEGGAAGGRAQRKAERPPSHQSRDSVSQDSRERALGRRAGSPGDRRTADTARAPRRPPPPREGPHCGRRLAEAQSVLRPSPRAPGSPQDRARGRLDESGDCERRRSARPCPGALSARGRGSHRAPNTAALTASSRSSKTRCAFPC